MTFQPRYEPGRYRDCPWCHGRGCAVCDAEADAAYKRSFPDGPKPIATYKLNDPADMEKCREVFGRDALQKAFGPDGGGMTEILSKLQAQQERE